MIPIFRAKKIDGDEYVEGGYSDTLFLCMGDIQGHYISYKKINVVGREITLQESIDPTTISIHFPDMLDSQGKKIFASLQGDCKGGDNVVYSDYKTIYTMVFDILKGIYAKNISNEYDTGYKLNPKLKIIGIQK